MQLSDFVLFHFYHFVSVNNLVLTALAFTAAAATVAEQHGSRMLC